MSDRPSLAAQAAPAIDLSRLRGLTGIEKPPAEPSLWEQVSTAARGAAANDGPGADQARRRDALDRELETIVGELRQRGIASDRYTRRLARDAFALSYDTDAIWAGVAQARAADPKAFAGIEPDYRRFEQRVTQPVAARIAQERSVQDRSSWVPWLAGQFYGSMTDPINQATTLVGAGQSQTILGAAVREAALNARVEAALTPATALERAAAGQDPTTGELAANIAIAAGAGAAFGGALKAGERAIARTPIGQLADEARATIPPERRTPAEQAALREADRTDEVLRASPFRSGPGSDAHLARMDAATKQLKDEGAIPQRRVVPRFDFNAYSIQVGKSESGGRWNAQSSTSTAYGMYQITEDTWLRTARTVPSLKGLSREALLNRRSNPAAQDAVFRALTDANRAALRRIGAAETHGNLYLMHFAGQGGAERILRAAPDTPIEQLLSARAINANRWLRGKSAADMREWAARKMGEAPDETPQLAPERFAGEGTDGGELAVAQQALDAAEADVQRSRQAMAERDRPPIDVPEPERAVGMDWDPADSPAPSPQQRWSDTVEQLSAARAGEVREALSHPEVGAIDVKWGEAGSGPNTGWGLSKILARHPEVVEQLPELIAEMQIASQTANRIRLESPDHLAVVRLDWEGAEQKWLLTAFEKERASPAAEDGRAAGGNRDGSPGSETATDIDPAAGDGNVPRPLREGWADDAAAGRTPQPAYVLRDADGEMLAIAPTREALADAAELTDADWEIVLARPPEGSEPPVPTRGFDDPDDIAAQAQADSLEHDLRMWLAEEEAQGLTVRLNDEGDVISAADAMDDLDTDWSALDAAEACMRP